MSLTVVSLTYLRFNSRLCELEVLGLLSSSYRARLAFGFNVVLWCLLLSACGAGLDPKYIEQGMPQNLSEWGQVGVIGSRFVVAEGVQPYDLASPLFTDYAHKIRTVWMPNGMTAQYSQESVFDFPVGTVITKTFYYPAVSGAQDVVLKKSDTSADVVSGRVNSHNLKLIETRILVRRDQGWVALPYRWNEAQTDAELMRTGDIVPLTLLDDDARSRSFNYIVPNANQCASCHAPNSNDRVLEPIGPKARHLNKFFAYDASGLNQLTLWREQGLLQGLPRSDVIPHNVDWSDSTLGIEQRARSYLDINCSHCHSPVGPADTSGLHLGPETAHGPALGICKPPIAAGRGTGNRRFDIVPGHPDQSILVYRTASTIADIMMPEIGRSLSHTEGTALLASWIEGLDGQCDRDLVSIY